jgi:diguanylate cyclase (GGDEF)-like protein
MSTVGDHSGGISAAHLLNITVCDWTGAFGAEVATLDQGVPRPDGETKRQVVLIDRQTAPRPDRTDHTRSAQGALRHTLSITAARSQDELVECVLAAAAHLTGASATAVFGPVGPIHTYGDEESTQRLHGLDPAVVRADGADAGLGQMIVADFIVADIAEHLIVLAAGEGRSLRPGAAPVLELLLAHARAASERLRELELLTHRANRDPLTGLRHHRPFVQRLAESRPGRTAIITLDIDGFKKVNDEHGHEAGDHALVTLVDALRAALRDDDQLYRIGGDEFAVVVDVNGPAEAVAIARRLLAAARRVGQTVSAGAAMHAPGETARQALVRADRALYEAKRAGRDTARMAGA